MANIYPTPLSWPDLTKIEEGKDINFETLEDISEIFNFCLDNCGTGQVFQQTFMDDTCRVRDYDELFTWGEPKPLLSWPFRRLSPNHVTLRVSVVAHIAWDAGSVPGVTGTLTIISGATGDSANINLDGTSTLYDFDPITVGGVADSRGILWDEVAFFAEMSNSAVGTIRIQNVHGEILPNGSPIPQILYGSAAPIDSTSYADKRALPAHRPSDLAAIVEEIEKRPIYLGAWSGVDDTAYEMHVGGYSKIKPQGVVLGGLAPLYMSPHARLGYVDRLNGLPLVVAGFRHGAEDLNNATEVDDPFTIVSRMEERVSLVEEGRITSRPSYAFNSQMYGFYPGLDSGFQSVTRLSIYLSEQYIPADGLFIWKPEDNIYYVDPIP